jgi:hypothetical protein
MADFFLLHRQTNVLFQSSSSGPLAVVEVGAPAAQAKANMNNFIDPLERASTQELQPLQHLCLLMLQAHQRRARLRWPGLALAAGAPGVPAATGCPKRTGWGICSLIVKVKGLLAMC